MRIVVGLSGGVDSSVAAALLLEQGHEVIGLYMRNWHDDSVTINNECPWVDDANDAMLVAAHLGIPFQVIDLSAEYKQRIVDVMFAEYAAGRTPNPDVLCNREIKFDIFLQAALELGAEAVATGHYCQRAVTEGEGGATYHLLAGLDQKKDQSYFLCQLNQDQIRQARFPIGHLEKSAVRQEARRLGLPTADKKDSQGLCFVGKVKLPTFLQQQLEVKPGRIIEIAADHPVFAERDATRRTNEWADVRPIAFAPEDGEEVGTHQGAHFFTIGQRKGLHVGGKPEPLFVIGRDVEQNVVYVGQGDAHPGLYRNALRIAAADVHWVRQDLASSLADGQRLPFQVRFRYRQPLQAATLQRMDNGDLHAHFEVPQRGIASGQFAAWHHGPECIGSGIIAD